MISVTLCVITEAGVEMGHAGLERALPRALTGQLRNPQHLAVRGRCGSTVGVSALHARRASFAQQCAGKRSCNVCFRDRKLRVSQSPSKTATQTARWALLFIVMSQLLSVQGHVDLTHQSIASGASVSWLSGQTRITPQN